jgi:hypothetical protein
MIHRISFLLLALLLPATARAQLVVPLTTADGRVACTQGMTGIGRPPDWRAVADDRAPDGWALAEMAGDATDLRFPLCISANITARDVDATLRFKVISGTREQAAGIVVRARSAADYYLVRASALDGSVRLYRVAAGRRQQIGGKEAPVKLGEWHTLHLRLVDETFDVDLDGKRVFTATDGGLRDRGPIGVWSQADSLVHFGSLLVAEPR